MSYDWMAALAWLGTLLLLSVIGRRLAFALPPLQRMRELNREADHQKMSRERFRDVVKASNKAGAITNVVFFVAILPWCVNLEPRPIWRHGVDIVAVLMVFDLFYYGTHRFLFHGKLLRRIHALHHQVRQPTHIDALFVHPLETTIGLVLFLGSIPLIAAVSGGPLHAFSAAVSMLIFTQVNIINHTYVNLPRFPFKTLDTITSIHAAHHVDMNRGNFATLTMLYDWLFRTLDEPVSRPAP